MFDGTKAAAASESRDATIPLGYPLHGALMGTRLVLAAWSVLHDRCRAT